VQALQDGAVVDIAHAPQEDGEEMGTTGTLQAMLGCCGLLVRLNLGLVPEEIADAATAIMNAIIEEAEADAADETADDVAAHHPAPHTREELLESVRNMLASQEGLIAVPRDLLRWGEVRLLSLNVEQLSNECQQRSIVLEAGASALECVAALMTWKKEQNRDQPANLPLNLQGWAGQKLSSLHVNQLHNECTCRSIVLEAGASTEGCVAALLAWKQNQNGNGAAELLNDPNLWTAESLRGLPLRQLQAESRTRGIRVWEQKKTCARELLAWRDAGLQQARV